MPFDFLIAHIQPIGEIVSEFFFMKFDFLADIEFLPEFDEDAVDGVVIIGVVASSGGKVQDDEVVMSFGLDQLLVVLEPLN